MTDKIATQFRTFYEGLYNLNPLPLSLTQADARHQKLMRFLRNFFPPVLSVADADSLTDPITPDEYKLARSQLKAGKSTGPDGFSVSYKWFMNILSPHFLKAFNSLPDFTDASDLPTGSTRGGDP